MEDLLQRKEQTAAGNVEFAVGLKIKEQVSARCLAEFKEVGIPGESPCSG